MTTIDTISLKGQRQSRRNGDFVRRMLTGALSIVSSVGHLMERRRTRLSLLELNDEQLKDIGISRADAYREAERSVTVAFDRYVG